jgi:hypothetical protein
MAAFPVLSRATSTTCDLEYDDPTYKTYVSCHSYTDSYLAGFWDAIGPAGPPQVIYRWAQPEAESKGLLTELHFYETSYYCAVGCSQSALDIWESYDQPAGCSCTYSVQLVQQFLGDFNTGAPYGGDWSGLSRNTICTP